MKVCWKCGFLDGHPDQVRPHANFNCNRKLRIDDPNIGLIVDEFFVELGKAKCRRLVDEYMAGQHVDLEFIEKVANLGLREWDNVPINLLRKAAELKTKLKEGHTTFSIRGA